MIVLKWSARRKALRNFEKVLKKGKKLAKNEENYCPTCVERISRIDFLSQKPDFRDTVLVHITKRVHIQR